MICAFCGKKIDDDSKFCPYCGGRLEGDAKATTCNLTNTLTKRGNIFYLKVDKKANIIYLVMIPFFAFATIVLLYTLSGLVPSVFKETGELGALLGFALLLILFGIVFIVLFMRFLYNAYRDFQKLPIPEDGKIQFAKSDLIRLTILKGLYSSRFMLRLHLQGKPADLSLNIQPAYLKKDAEEIADQLVTFFGGHVPVKWIKMNAKLFIKGMLKGRFDVSEA